MKRAPTTLAVIAAAVFFTSSFDIFLNINAGPNIRVAQILSIILVAAALFATRLGFTMELPLGATFLVAWLAIQLAFVPAAEFWQKSLAYCVWLALNIALSFAFVNLFSGDPRQILRLFKVYLASFVFVACFGILQFVLPLLGGPALLVEQWWIPGSIPRVNGFSFEPSYYATYLLMGLVSLGSLRRSRIAEYRSWRWTAAYLLIVAAMILCSSRTGLAFLALELLITPARKFWRILRAPSRVLAFRISGLRIVATAALIWAITAGSAAAWEWFNDHQQTVQILVSGTGLMGTAAHSIDEREDHLHDTLQTIADHPLIGQSLGGITESVAGYIGVKPMNFEETKTFEGQSVFAEAVAASGWPGSIPFFCFVVITIVAPLRLARHVPALPAAWLRALAVSLAFEWAILQFNQNVLRLYLWVHIAVLAAVYAAVRRQYGLPVESGGSGG